MDLNEGTINEISMKRFLIREKEYKEIAKNEVVKKMSEHYETVGDIKNIKYLIMGVISGYDFEISQIKRKIKDKVIVETLYSDDMKEASLKQFPPYI